MVDLVKVRKKAKEKKGMAPPTPAAPGGNAAEVGGGTQKSKIERFLETAGQRRATKKQESNEPAKAQIELLTFDLAGELYAIDIEHVVEIVTPRPITRVPNADPSVVGILSLRGMIVTLIDARSRLRHRAAEGKGPDVRIIVVDLEGQSMGFVVDRVLRVVKVEVDAVEPHPVVHTSEQEESVRGVFRHDDALTILLDLEKLLGVVRNGTYV